MPDGVLCFLPSNGGYMIFGAKKLRKRLTVLFRNAKAKRLRTERSVQHVRWRDRFSESYTKYRTLLQAGTGKRNELDQLWGYCLRFAARKRKCPHALATELGLNEAS